MPVALSAGLLLYRRREGTLEVLLAHPGGPFWARRDEGAWSIPKGEIEPGEEPVVAAIREFTEELGVAPPDGAPRALGEVRLRSRKRVFGWALEGDVTGLDLAHPASNEFEMEWPPRSGRRERFPEVDRAGWFDVATARRKLLAAQVPLLDALEVALGEEA